MIRSSQHTLKFANENKQVWLQTLFRDYQLALQQCINLIINNKLPLGKFLTSKEIPTLGNIQHSWWKQVIYKQSSEIIRSQIKKANAKRYKKYKYLYSKCKKNNKHQAFTNKKWKQLKLNNIIYTRYFTLPNIKNISINLDSRFWNSEGGNSFDEFIKITLPYFYKDKKIARTIKIPIKQHKHSLRYKDWNRKNTIQLSQYGIKFIYEKEAPIKREIKNSIGIDIGYKKLISTSSGNYYGIKLQKIYEKLSRQKQGSLQFKRTLKERDNLINQFCNELDKTETFDEIIIENLKNVKHKSKFGKKTNNKLQRWSYPKVIDKLEKLSEEKGFSLTKVNPAYTSQICNNCGELDKSNRKGEIYQCSCGTRMDADTNAAINILHRGIYSSSANKSDLSRFIYKS